MPANGLIGGWQVNGIALFQSGFPFTMIAEDVDFYNHNYGQRADLVGDPYPSGFQKNQEHWFNTDAFANPVRGAFGNTGRNIVEAAGINNWDLSLFKNFKMPFSGPQMQRSTSRCIVDLMSRKCSSTVQRRR